MVDKVTAFKASDDSLHEDWYAAASVSAAPFFLALIPDAQTISRDAIARNMAHLFFVEKNREALEAFAALTDLIDDEPKHENVVAIRPGETTQGGKFKMPRILGGKS